MDAPGANGKGKGGAIYIHGDNGGTAIARGVTPSWSGNVADDDVASGTDNDNIYGAISGCPSMTAVVSGSPDGCTARTATVTVTGGTPPYRVVLSDGSTATGSSPLSISMTPGTRTAILVLDSAGCATVATGGVTMPACGDLVVTKTATPNPVLSGQTVTYTITVTNNGPDAAPAVTMSDDLPGSLAPPTLQSFVDDDDTLAEFGGATHTLTQWDAGNNWVELTGTTNGWEMPGGANASGWTDMTGNVLLYHHNETASPIVDYSGAGNNGVYPGNYINQPGKLGASTGYGVSAVDRITAPASPSLNVAGPMTLMTWFRPQNVNTQPILEYNNSSASGVHLWQWPSFSQLWINFLDTTGASHGLGSPAGSLVAGTWYHAAAVYDGTFGYLYLDGVLIASANFGAFTPQTSYSFVVGSRPQSSNYYNGYVDETAIFNRPLSAAQIARIYRRQAPLHSGWIDSTIKDAGAGTSWNSLGWLPQFPSGKPLPGGGQSESGYAAGNANMVGNLLLLHLDEASGNFADSSAAGATATPLGGVTHGAEGKIGSSAQFDGVDDGIDVPSNPAFELTTGTVEAWIRPTWGSGVPTYQPAFVALRTGAATRFSLHLQKDYSQLHFFNGTTSALFPVTMRPYEWHHVAFTFQNGGAVTAYVDGAQAGSPVTFAVGNLTGSPFRIGYSGDPAPANQNERFIGNIDEVGYYSRVLPAAEIADHYRRGATRLRFQIRTCDDAACAGEIFAGPDGSASTWFSEPGSEPLTPPTLAISSAPVNRWFQYRASLESDDPGLSPDLRSATVTGALDVTTTQGTCWLIGQKLGCSLGPLATGASATITVPCVANAAGTIVNTASATSSIVDPSAANSSGSASVQSLNPLTDDDNDGTTNAYDCKPLDNSVWSLPGPAQSLLLTGDATTTLAWAAPSVPGGNAVVYDVLRSTNPSGFSAATCILANGSGLTTQDSAIPAACYYYLVRAENGCGSNLGTDSLGVPRSGVACP